LRQGSKVETLESAGYVEFAATGQPVAGAFRCTACGYGVTVRRELPLCPMCGSTVWELAAWSPFGRRAGGPLL
jgi:rubrerythrin